MFHNYTPNQSSTCSLFRNFICTAAIVSMIINRITVMDAAKPTSVAPPKAFPKAYL